MHGRLRRVAILIAAIAGSVLAAPPAPGSAGSSHATFSLVALPPALTLGSSRSGLVKAVFTTLDTTATHTLLTVTSSQPISPTVLPTACTADSTSSNTTITCALGQVGPRTTRSTLIEFQSPAACGATCALTLTGTVTFAEGNTNQGSDTLSAASVIQLFAATARAAADGDCVSTPSTLGTQATTSAQQATQVHFGLAAASLPCTPGATGVDPQVAPTPLHTNISFVALPSLTQPATLEVTFFTLPHGVNSNSFVLQELVNYAFGTPVTAATQFFAVPVCQNGAIPPGGPSGLAGVTFDSCVLSQAPYGQGGVIVTLLVRPSGDPGYGG